ncbi:MAG: hypothetical protein RLZZ384_722 [Pseudomonadota bacterium]
MRIITFNANGIRSAERKGFFTWLAQQNADFVCIQETKAQIVQLDAAVFHPESYHCFYHDAQKKGYSGVALYCREKPDEVIYGMGDEEIDFEGRYIEARIGNLSVISLYLPSGSSGEITIKSSSPVFSIIGASSILRASLIAPGKNEAI